VCPSGTFYLMHGFALQNAERHSEAEGAFCRAVRAPSPAPGVVRRALFELTFEQILRARSGATLRSQLEPMIRENLRELAVSGPYPGWAYNTLTIWANEF